MKRFFILLLLAVSTISCAQEKEIFWVFDWEIKPYMEDFISDSQKHGYLTRKELAQKIDYVIFAEEDMVDENGRLILGVAYRKSRVVLISPSLKYNPVVLRTTIYHEVGHLLTEKGHSCNQCYDIMSAQSPKNLKPYLREDFWEYEVKQLFDYLKK